MSRSKWLRTAAQAAILLAAMSVWFFLYNPRIGGTSYGDTYRCLAPWDTVLNGASNYPGGDPPADAAEIAAQCRQAGQRSFNAAVGTGIGAATALAAVGVLAVAGRRGDRAPTAKHH